MLNKVLLFSWLSILLTQGHLSAQSKEYDIFQLRFLYNEVKFDEVIQLGRTLLKNPERLDQKDLEHIHKYLALSFFNTGLTDSSRSHFYTLLSINPDFEPDPIQTSPKILEFFGRIKSSFEKEREKRTVIPYTQYVFVEDIRPAAALRSLLLPGWGQWYKKQPSKAYLFGGAFISATLSVGISYALEKNMRQKYLDEKDPARIAGRYDDYNTMSKTRRIMQYTALALWGASIADALFSSYDPLLQPRVDEQYLGLSLQITF